MSIILTGTAESIKIVLDAAPATNQCPATVNYGQVAGNLGDATVLTTGTTPATLLTGNATAPLVVNSIQFPNVDTAQRTLTVTKVTGAGTFVLAKVILPTLCSLYYDSAHGWYCLDSFGNFLSGSSLPAGVTLNQPNIIGVTNGSNAATGSVGEYVTGTASAVPLTTTVATNLVSIVLTAGDWDVDGGVFYQCSAANLINGTGGSSSTSATFMGVGSYFQYAGSAVSGLALAIPTWRYSLTTTTTLYCVVSATFSTGTVSGHCSFRARRTR